MLPKNEVYKRLRRFLIKDSPETPDEEAKRLRRRHVEAYASIYGESLRLYGRSAHVTREAEFYIRAYEMMTPEEILMTEQRVLEIVHSKTERLIENVTRAHEETRKSRLIFSCASAY